MPQGMSPQQWFWMNLMSQMTGQPVPSFAEPTPVSGTDPVFDQYSGYTPPTDQRPSTIATGAGPPSPAAGGYPVYPDYTGWDTRAGPWMSPRHQPGRSRYRLTISRTDREDTPQTRSGRTCLPEVSPLPRKCRLTLLPLRLRHLPQARQEASIFRLQPFNQETHQDRLQAVI